MSRPPVELGETPERCISSKTQELRRHSRHVARETPGLPAGLPAFWTVKSGCRPNVIDGTSRRARTPAILIPVRSAVGGQPPLACEPITSPAPPPRITHPAPGTVRPPGRLPRTNARSHQRCCCRAFLRPPASAPASLHAAGGHTTTQLRATRPSDAPPMHVTQAEFPIGRADAVETRRNTRTPADHDRPEKILPELRSGRGGTEGRSGRGGTEGTGYAISARTAARSPLPCRRTAAPPRPAHARDWPAPGSVAARARATR